MTSVNKQFVDEYYSVHKQDELLGQGGQGMVFRTKDPDIAVKLLIDSAGKPLTDDAYIARYSARLKQVRLLPLPDNLPLAAPVAVLKDHVGYVMQLLSDMVPFSSFWPGAKELSAITDIPRWLGKVDEAAGKRIVHYQQAGGLRRRLTALAKCSAILARLHGSGLVYGDISPSNIYISQDPLACEVWLIDADNLRFETAKAGSGVYTPRYGAPELVQGLDGCRARSDCHAFSVLAYHLLTMVHPFIGDLVEKSDVDWADTAEAGDALEDQAYAGLLPWVGDEEDDRNVTSRGLPSALVLTNRLQELFQATFGPGRTKFWRRPAIYHWPVALAQAADITIQCSACGMSWFYDYPEDKCPYCIAPRPATIVLTAYRWNGPGQPLGAPCWTMARELPPEGRELVMPERLLAPFIMTSHDQPRLKLVITAGKVLLIKGEDCTLDIIVASSNENGGRFKSFVAQLQLPATVLHSGFWLYASGSERRLIHCAAGGWQ